MFGSGFSFGSNAASSPAAPASTNSFSFGTPGGAANTANTAGSSTLVGGSTFGGSSQSTAPASQAPSTGLFGAPAAQPASTGGLFGASSTAPAGGLFGGGAGQQQAQTQSTGGMFGQAQNQNQQQQQQGGGLFGQPQNAQSSTGLFGQNSTLQKPTGGLFGSTQAQPQQSNMFGQPQNQPQQNSGLFGQQNQSQLGQQPGGLFGQNQGQGQGMQGSTNTQGGMNKNQRFTDLSEPLQKELENLDNMFRQQRQLGSELNIERLGGAIKRISADVDTAQKEYNALSQNLEAISTILSRCRAKNATQIDDITKWRVIWEAILQAQRTGARNFPNKEFPSLFFKRIAEEMQERLTKYQERIGEINHAIASSRSDRDEQSPQAIAQTINNHQRAILALAQQLDGLQCRIADLKIIHTNEYQERTASSRDPFQVARESSGGIRS